MGSFAQTMDLDVPLLFYNKEALLATFNPNSLVRPADMMNNLKGKSMAFSLKIYYESVRNICTKFSKEIPANSKGYNKGSLHANQSIIFMKCRVYTILLAHVMTIVPVLP